MTLDRLGALERATAEFDRRVRLVTDDQWAAPTDCGEWDVAALVDHVIGGNRMAAAIARGASRDEGRALFEGAQGTGDRVAGFEASAADQLAALAEPGALDRTVEHTIGDVSGAQLLGFRIGDLTLHAWDLSRAIGADDLLDADLVEACWEDLQPMAPIIGQIGVFGEGPSGAVADEAPLQERLLDLTGRRP